MAEQALAPVRSREPRGMPDMRRLAKRVVDGMPKVQAVVLFGSRARKTARRDSDWDVALLTPERYEKEVLWAVPRIPSVNYVSFSPKRLRERHNRLGTFERSVAVDGILLAGEWTMPEPQKRLTVSYGILEVLLETSANNIDSAISHLQNLLMEGGLPSMDNTLCSRSHNAAERLSKAALLHLCIHPARTHDALRLADALQEKHPNHPWQNTIASIDEHLAVRRVAEYAVEGIEEIENSLDRLCRVMKFYEEVLTAITRKRLRFTRQIFDICRLIVIIVSKYQRGIGWDRYPDDLKQHLLQWKEMAAQIMENDPDGWRAGETGISGKAAASRCRKAKLR